MKTRRLLVITSLIAMFGLVLMTADAWARASGGGSRGSRSFSSPARPSPATPSTPSSPSRSLSQPAAPMAPQRPGMFGGLMGGIAGFALGGLLGGLLFGGLGQGLGGLGGGIGLMEILLIGGGIVLLVMFLRRRRQAASQPAYAGTAGGASAYGAAESMGGGTATITPEMPAAETGDLERGVAHIRSMDGTFDPAAVVETARRMFQGVQQAVTMRDVVWMRDHFGAEIFATLQAQCDRLRADKRTNRMEKIDVRGADVTEAWQESGHDYVTVRLTGSMLDYTVDDATSDVVDGSRTTPADFDEYWTFTRSVGPNRWTLSAIQTA